MNRNPSLDVIRIIATISVVVGHLFQHSVPILLVPFTSYGGFGVALFFLLSGYLVTSSVVKNPNWKSFLTLRSFRILPAYFLAIGLYSGLKLFEGTSYTIREIFMYLTLTGYLGGIEPTLAGVEWTLRIEVLFYSIAVFCLYIYQATDAKLKIRRSHSIVLLLSSQVLMGLLTPYFPVDQRPLTFGQCIITGILIGLSDKYSIVWKYSILLVSLMIAEASMRLGIEHYDNIPFITMAVIFFLLLTPINLRLSPKLSTLVNFAANCTYAVYLYHNWALRDFLKRTSWPSVAIFVFLVLVSATYILIEKPLNNVGKKLAR